MTQAITPEMQAAIKSDLRNPDSRLAWKPVLVWMNHRPQYNDASLNKLYLILKNQIHYKGIVATYKAIEAMSNQKASYPPARQFAKLSGSPDSFLTNWFQQLYNLAIAGFYDESAPTNGKRLRYERRYLIESPQTITLPANPEAYEYVEDKLRRLGFDDLDESDPILSDSSNKDVIVIDIEEPRGDYTTVSQTRDGRILYKDPDGGLLLVSTKPVKVDQILRILRAAERMGNNDE